MRQELEGISTPKPKEGANKSTASSIKVLHVDDEPQFAQTTALFLKRESEHIDVETETSPENVLERLDADGFDCIVCDYQMPKMNGIEVLEQVREDYPDIPFILFTGKGSEKVASKSISLGVSDYLQKERGTDQYTVLANRIENAVARVRAEQAASDYKQRLELRDQELERTLAASPDAVIIVDENGTIRQANSEAARLFDYLQEDLIGTSVEQLLPESLRERHVSLREEYMQDPKPRPMGDGLELSALRQDGETFPVEISLGPLNIDSEPRIMATISDITERKKKEEELRRQNKRLDEFASIVSHDLRGPLAIAMSNYELVREEYESENLTRIRDSLDRMDDLIEDLLTYARQGTRVIEPSPVPLSQVVEKAWSRMETETATLQIAADLRTIICDEDRLLQLLENLFRNAISYSGSDVTIGVGTITDGFYIADNGPGIPPSEREKVFETGYSTDEEGTGFGLAIVKQIVDAHRWSIHIDESASGGARFDIRDVTIK